MITLEVFRIIGEAEADLDDMDFTHLFGHKDGLDLFTEFNGFFNRNLVEFSAYLSDERKMVFIDYLNDQFAPET